MAPHDFRSQEFCNQIKKELLYIWDPIGIKEYPGAFDEYDRYAIDMINLLLNNSSESQIFDFLWWLETKHMGLLGNEQNTKSFASYLFGKYLQRG